MQSHCRSFCSLCFSSLGFMVTLFKNSVVLFCGSQVVHTQCRFHFRLSILILKHQTRFFFCIRQGTWSIVSFLERTFVVSSRSWTLTLFSPQAQSLVFSHSLLPEYAGLLSLFLVIAFSSIENDCQVACPPPNWKKEKKSGLSSSIALAPFSEWWKSFAVTFGRFPLITNFPSANGSLLHCLSRGM